MIMEKKINIAELLKDCPKGMELDCAMCDNVTFVCILDGNCFPIQIQTPEGNMWLSKYGCMSLSTHAKCVIFPKGKTTWEGFHRPFDDGDIVFTTLGNIAIIRKPIEGELFCVYGIMVGSGFYKDETAKVVVARLATEEEKQRLFNAIKKHGYKWNAKTKTLEKLVEPYKEETMEERDEKAVNHVFETEVISFDIAQRDKYELDLQGKFEVVLREGKYYVERIKPKYPQTYEECCEVLSLGEDGRLYTKGYKASIIQDFQKLIICRDAYWKIAGDWKPDWNDNSKFKYIITCKRCNILMYSYSTLNCILAFPTDEIRDVFYGNFKELIEECKELL